MAQLMDHHATAADLAQADSGRLQQVRAPGRLHLGFFDPGGSLGRRFGSLGLVIEGFETVVELRAADHDSVLCDAAADGAADTARAVLWLNRLRLASVAHGLPAALARQPLQLRLRQRLPAHAGFGSGTQLALAVGRAFAGHFGLAVGTAELARWLGRGVRSGVGIAGFDQGGLLADGGPGADGRPAPLLSRIGFPADWRVLVVQDPRLRGLSGQRETQAMAELPPLPQPSAADICHQVLMRVLPAAALHRREVCRRPEPGAAGAGRALRADAGRQRLHQPGGRPAAALGGRGRWRGGRPKLLGPDRFCRAAQRRACQCAAGCRAGGRPAGRGAGRADRGCTQPGCQRAGVLRRGPGTAPAPATAHRPPAA